MLWIECALNVVWVLGMGAWALWASSCCRMYVPAVHMMYVACVQVLLCLQKVNTCKKKC